MPGLSYITTCKGRLAHLQQTLPRVLGQPGVACIVVDYSCPDGAAEWVGRTHPGVRVVKVSGEPGFSAPRARNLGAAAAATEWLAFFDADIEWSPDFATRVVPTLQAGHFYRPGPVTQQTWGSVICRREDFVAVGGYDEAIVGWGGEDDDLYARLVLAGVRPSAFPASLVSEIPHDDGLRVRFYAVKNRATQHRINMLYVQAKLDLMRMLGSALPLDTRQTLFAEVCKAVSQAIAAGQSQASLDVRLPEQLVKPPPIDGIVEHWHLGRRLIYNIDIAARYVERLPA